MYSLDLKSAYYSVGVDPRLGRTMGFKWQGKYYRFQVLPFGFKSSPHAFVKIGRNIVKKWRAQGPGQWSQRFGNSTDANLRAGSKVMLYIDDSLGAHTQTNTLKGPVRDPYIVAADGLIKGFDKGLCKVVLDGLLKAMNYDG